MFKKKNEHNSSSVEQINFRSFKNIKVKMVIDDEKKIQREHGAISPENYKLEFELKDYGSC